MDYYKSVQNAVNFIEANLQEQLHVTDIAAAARFSPFHFQRVFQAVSGFSVQEYIRKRRLSEAAAVLMGRQDGVLSIAMAYGYGSQEAFTRAFEAEFGMTPARYRRAHEGPINRVNRLDFLNMGTRIKGEMKMNKPEIVQLDTIRIIGYEYQTRLTGEEYFSEIPGFYADFGSKALYERIPGRIRPAMAYGIPYEYRDDETFTFVVGEESEAGAGEAAEGFVHLELAAGRYAVFPAAAPASGLPNMWRYIYETWLPNSNYERREGPDFEVTDVCASASGKLAMKIYIPIV